MSLELRLKHIRRFIERMPSLSTTVTKVMKVCNSPNASPNELNRLISLDPVLTGKLLKLVNSAYYGVACRITSLTHAIIMLGVNTVKNMVLATSILANLKMRSEIKRIPIDSFWAHSLCVGVTAKAMAKARQVPGMEQEEYFVSGLMHDMGKLPIMVCFPELYQKALKQAALDQAPLFEIEQALFGFDHCYVGKLIAAKWRLNTEMGMAITDHHQPYKAGSKPNLALGSISLANQAALQFEIGSAGDPYKNIDLFEELAFLCGTTAEDILALKQNIEQEIKKARVFLQISGKG